MDFENKTEMSNYFGDAFRTSNIFETEQESKSNNGSMSKIKLHLEDIQEAHNRNIDKIVVTPVVAAKFVGNNFCNVLFKCENLQFTGSFKVRGTLNIMSCMTPAEKIKGCTASGGRNFLRAMTYSGFKESIPVNVVIPRDTPIVDRQMYKENFAIIKTYGNDLTEASLHALTYCNEIGSHFVGGSDRWDLLAGYGTVGLEVLSQIDQLDAVICPVGTGGLIASLILAIKSLKPNCLMYGVESSSAPTMTRALQENRPIMVPVKTTAADSISDNNIASNNAFNVIKRYLNKMITVDEMWISRAVLNLLEREKIVVEPAAASPAAAIMAGKVPELHGMNVVCILTGGNVNLSRFPRTLDRGLMGDGRLIVFSVSLPDTPNAVARLFAKVMDTGAWVRSFEPERSWMKRDSLNMTVCMLIETSDANHAKDLEKKLLKDYPFSKIILD